MMGGHLTFAVMPLLSPRPRHHLGTDVPIIRAATKRKVESRKYPFSPRAKNDGAKGLLVGAQSPVQQSQDAIAFPIPGKDTRRSHCA